jgi:hypothetical protein
VAVSTLAVEAEESAMGDPFLNYFALLVLIFVVAVLLYGITAHRNQGQRLGPIRARFRRQDRAMTAARVAN